jgi:hypothetical protein
MHAVDRIGSIDDNGSVEVFALSDGRFARVVAATTGRFEAPGLGATVDVHALWAEVARLDP